MDSPPSSSLLHAQPHCSTARKVDSPPARPALATTAKKAGSRSQLFAFTVRLTPKQRSHFEALTVAQGHASVAAAFKAQALSYGMEHPLQEMCMSLEHMQEGITEKGAWLQERIHLVLHALDGVDQHLEDLMAEMQTCTQAMLLFAQTNEALSIAVVNLGAKGALPSAPTPSKR